MSKYFPSRMNHSVERLMLALIYPIMQQKPILKILRTWIHQILH